MEEDFCSAFKQLCHKHGWKCTPQRLSVYRFLHGNHTHPDVDTIWTAVRQTLPSITRESVYRILNEFAEKDIIGRVDHLSSARFDSRVGPHGHFICERCGKICDFDWPEGTVISPDMQSAGQVRHMEIRLVGICQACAAQVSGGSDAGYFLAPPII